MNFTTTPQPNQNVNNLNTSEKEIKKVSFSHGTALPRQVTIATTISRHENIEQLGYTTYTIQCWRAGRAWILKRRYRHFEALLADLLVENNINEWHIQLPLLPKKRWFETQRWINKYESNYSTNRRKALQSFLRSLLKIPKIIENSNAIRQFLEIKQHCVGLNECDLVGMDSWRYQGQQYSDHNSSYSSEQIISENNNNDVINGINNLKITGNNINYNNDDENYSYDDENINKNGSKNDNNNIFYANNGSYMNGVLESESSDEEDSNENGDINEEELRNLKLQHQIILNGIKNKKEEGNILKDGNNFNDNIEDIINEEESNQINKNNNIEINNTLSLIFNEDNDNDDNS